MIQPIYDNRIETDDHLHEKVLSEYNNTILYFQRHKHARSFMIFLRKNKDLFDSQKLSSIDIYGESTDKLSRELKSTGRVSSIGKIDYQFPESNRFSSAVFDYSFNIVNSDGVKLFLWLRENLQEKIWYDNRSIYFQSEKDLAWFVLKWGTEEQKNKN